MPEEHLPIRMHPGRLESISKLVERGKSMNEEIANKAFWNTQPTAKLIAERANAFKLWVFDPIDKQWYSPDEFEECFNKLFAGNPMFQRVQFKDPLEGIAAGFIHLDQTKDKLAKLVNRVIAYYKNDLPPPTPTG